VAETWIRAARRLNANSWRDGEGSTTGTLETFSTAMREALHCKVYSFRRHLVQIGCVCLTASRRDVECLLLAAKSRPLDRSKVPADRRNAANRP
jgi:hypothetical protein